MAGVAAVSNLRKFSSGGYHFPNAPTFSFCLGYCGAYIPVGVQDVSRTATESNDRPVAYSIHDRRQGRVWMGER